MVCYLAYHWIELQMIIGDLLGNVIVGVCQIIQLDGDRPGSQFGIHLDTTCLHGMIPDGSHGLLAQCVLPNA
jgi:hypothetical protein